MKSLRQMYLEMTEQYSIDNEDLALLFFHVLMGQVFKESVVCFGDADKKDLRISVLGIQPTRSGKGQAMKVLKRAANRLGLRVAKETDVTSAGMIGTIDNGIMKLNTVKGLTPDDKNWKDPIIYGDLFYNDIIIYDEAKTLLKPGKWSENIHDVLQEALDTPGEVRKKLACPIPIEYPTKSSIAATTYYLDEIKSVMLGQGFFQRILIHYKEIPREQRKDLRRKVLFRYKTDEEKKDEERSDIKFAQLLEEFYQRVKKLPKEEEVVLSKKALKEIDKIVEKYENYIEKHYRGQEYISLLSFIHGLQEQFIKISAHYALIDGKTTVQPNHVTQGKFIIDHCMRSLMNGLIPKIAGEHKGQNVLKYKQARQLLKSRPVWTREEFYKEFQIKFAVCRSNAIPIINALIAQNDIVEERGERNTKLLRINEE